MALPTTLDKTSPAGVDASTLGDDQIRALKLAIEDIFGVPDATAMAAALFEVVAAGLKAVRLRDVTGGLPTATTHFGKLYVDVSGGKHRLHVLFPTGAAQLLATEP